jgi:hypothetical protein
MTVAVNKLLTDFGILTNDADSVQWPEAERVSWLNEGQVALVVVAKQVDAKIKTITLALTAGAKQANPADCISIIEVRQNLNGNSVTKCDRATLDRFLPGWMNAMQSATIQHFMDDPQPDAFFVYPPAQSGAQIVMTYGAVPATVSAGGNIDVRDIYADRLLNYMLYRAYSKDAEGANAARAQAAYQLFIGA